jgi:nucleoside-diphosphate-sugar epimerase
LAAGTYSGSTKDANYVIGSGESQSVAQVWDLIAHSVGSHTGKNVSVRVDESVTIEPLELRNFVADTKRFHNATGWKHRTGLAQGIDITVRAFLSKSGRSL